MEIGEGEIVSSSCVTLKASQDSLASPPQRAKTGLAGGPGWFGMTALQESGNWKKESAEQSRRFRA
jgi:hypothetical protein